MDPHVPGFISWMFILVTFAALYILYYAIRQQSKKVAVRAMVLILIWLILVGVLAVSGFYLKVTTQPFRFFLGAPLAFITIILLFVLPSSRQFIKGLSLELLTYLSAIRIPVELVLWWLFLYNQVPQVMTFEGRNFDIIAGITAPIIGYFVFTKKKWSKIVAFIWNLASLLLLVNIISHAVLALPTPFQQLALDSPNWGILYFPFIWLPAFVAPLVLFSHLVSIYQLRVRSF